MKQKFTLVLIFVLVGLLTACGRQTVTVVVTATPEPATPTTEAADQQTEADDSSTPDASESDSTAPAPEAEVQLPDAMVPSPDAPGPAAEAGRLAIMGPYASTFQVFVMNADGSGLQMLSDGQTESIFPTLSPDGTRVAFATEVGQNDLDIVVADLESGQVEPLTDGPVMDNQPVWSPDGERIAFVSNRDGPFAIYVMNADGSDVRRIAEVNEQAFSPLGGWSPDSTRLVYATELGSGERAIRIVDVSSGEVSEVTRWAGEEANPIFSPDGERVTFHSDRSGPQRLNIYSTDTEGHNLQALTNGEGPVIFPMWSPDGRWLAFTMIEGQQTLTINLMPTGSGPVHQVQDPRGEIIQGVVTSWVPAGEPLADTGFSQTPTFEVSEALIASAPAKGDPNAPVTVVEFSDYECPFCKRFFDETLDQLQSYVDDGTVRFVWIDFPLTKIHPQAFKAALAARCAADQGGQDMYWQMHDQLFEAQSQWAGENSDALAVFTELAQNIGLDGETLQACIEAETFSDDVQAGLREGQRLQVSGTPTFFINGEKLVGAQPIDAFEATIEAALTNE